MKEFIVETDLDLSCVVEFSGAGGVSFKPHGELIRCKDCKHRDRYECNRIRLGETKCGVTDDWFCADGERKD